jgi:hypothetical protein
MKSSKRLLIVSAMATIIAFGFSSCKKEEPKPPVKSPLEILTATPWKIDEIRFLQQNKFYYYKRGGSNNNINFDAEYYKFNKDNTGERYDLNESYSFTWSFASDDKTKIKIIIDEVPKLEVMWENLIYDENSLKYSEYYSREGANSLAVATRIPK